MPPYTYKNLYEFAENYVIEQIAKGDGAPIFVPISKLIRELEKGLLWLRHVDIRPIADTSRADRVWGRYRLFADQDQHDEFDNKVVEIAHGDWQNWCYKRFVVCKELMHTFDGISARVSGQEGFDLLADEIEADQEPETRPRQRSPQLQSEIDAQWKALLLVVPVPQRNDIAKAHPPIDPDYIAKTYRIPRVLVRALLSQDYEDAVADFLN